MKEKWFRLVSGALLIAPSLPTKRDMRRSRSASGYLCLPAWQPFIPAPQNRLTQANITKIALLNRGDFVCFDPREKDSPRLQ
jgi:hypothetical protein